ncbi:MAG: hypothetical protein J0L51_07780 [Rhizobiales bacterium]|nr:hypothetical protein [Hyphomicrobiales bacterium]
MAEGRLELQVPISGYVIAQDRSLGAKAEAFWHKARYLALRVAVRSRRTSRAVQQRTAAFLARFRAGCARLIASAPAVAMIGVAGRIGASFALIGHLAGQDDAVARATFRPRRKRAGLLAVGVIALAFGAALLMPERAEPVWPADAAIAPEPAPVVLAERSQPPPPAFTPASLSAAPAQWQPLRKPMAMFHLESPDLAGLEMTYRVSMRGNSRQDSLTWLPREDASGEARRALAQFVIERHEGSQTTERPLFADLASRAAEQHLVIERMARPQDIRTKFGPMEAAEATIRHDGKPLACIGFRRIDMTGLTLVGWVCGAAQRPVDRVALSCFVDRLDLVGGGRDAGLRKLFAEAERARTPCSSSRQSGKRLTWLDHEAPLPGLKLSARGR